MSNLNLKHGDSSEEDHWLTLVIILLLLLIAIPVIAIYLLLLFVQKQYKAFLHAWW